MRDLVLVLDREGQYLSIAPTSTELLSHPPSELLGRTITEFFQPAQAELLMGFIHEALQSDVPVKVQYSLPVRGKEIWFEGEVIPIGDGTVLWTVRDGSDRKRTEEALKRSRELLEDVIEGTSDVIYMKDLEGRYVMANSAQARLHGLTVEEIIGKTDFDLHGEAAGRKIRERDASILASGRSATYEHSVELSDGTHWFSPLKQVRRDANGDVIGLFGISRDVTERKRTEDALVKLAAIVESSNDAIIGVSVDGAVASWNLAAERLLGFRADEIIGQPIVTVVPPECRAESLDSLRRLKRGEAVDLYETVRLHRNGSRVPVSLNIFPIRDAKGEILGFAGFMRDIVARLRLEAQLRQAQKMDAVGRLAGGIAHDFNNLLAAIKVHCELLTEQLRPGSAEHADATEICKAADRAATLTRQLLAFSRKQVMQPKIVNLNDIVAEMERMLRRIIGENIAVTTTLQADLHLVKADPGQIEQVLMNLAVNSRDAMPDGGGLNIKTSNVLVDGAAVLRHPGLALGAYAMITVSDTGTGMTPAIQAHVFEPFFTTKEQGKGTGLGLATVYGIVMQSGGFVSVHSDPGMGTTFKIYLPQVAGTPETVKKRGSLPGLPVGTETVLIVDDEESVRSSIRRILAKCGYSTIEARDGAEALEMFAQQADTIDLVITDVVMPGLGGRGLAEALLKIRPGLKMIFMSGYTEDAATQQGVLAPGSAFIEKPFTLQAFAKSVRDTLDAPSAKPAPV